jgi:8-amino-7-oxononanoate synthase
MSILDRHREQLARLAAEQRLRALIPRAGLDFSSNDYLGLAGSRALDSAVAEALARGVSVGAGGSRLLRGNDPEHEALEAEAARYFGADSALFLANGFAANCAIFGNLPDRRDLIVYDALIHASVHDGMRLGFAAKAIARHNDPQSFDDVIAEWRMAGGKGRPWIAIESLYSMDGHVAPIDDFAAVARRHDAFLVIDEAHAAGVFGAGLAARLGACENLIRLVTCGKALGCEGALVLAHRTITETLVNRGRGFIFSTAPSPLIAAAVRGSLRLLEAEPERRAALQHLIAEAGRLLGPRGVEASGTQIMPLIIGDEGETMRTAARLQAAGFDIRGIRPPTVPQGTSRLRISITLNVDAAAVAALAEALA